jgi:hypothetical protein
MLMYAEHFRNVYKTLVENLQREETMGGIYTQMGG